MIRSVTSKIQSINRECDFVTYAMIPSDSMKRILPIREIFMILFSFFILLSFSFFNVIYQPLVHIF